MNIEADYRGCMTHSLRKDSWMQTREDGGQSEMDLSEKFAPIPRLCQESDRHVSFFKVFSEVKV